MNAWADLSWEWSELPWIIPMRGSPKQVGTGCSDMQDIKERPDGDRSCEEHEL